MTGLVKHPLIRPDDATREQFDLLKALYVCTKIAEGRTFDEIFVGGDPKAPTRHEFMVWSLTNSDLAKALEAARQLSAYAFEDEALSEARKLAANPGSPHRVSAYKAALEQLRWSAERRNSGAFGNKGVQTTVIPISIQTTLDLGQEGGGQRQGLASDIYTVTAQVSEVVDTAYVELPSLPKQPEASPSAEKPLPAGLRSADSLEESN